MNTRNAWIVVIVGVFCLAFSFFGLGEQKDTTQTTSDQPSGSQTVVAPQAEQTGGVTRVGQPSDDTVARGQVMPPAGAGAGAGKVSKAPTVNVRIPDTGGAAIVKGRRPVIPTKQALGLPNLPKVPKKPAIKIDVKPVILPHTDMTVKKLQKQIDDMIRLNESLKVRFKSQAAKLQRISDEARIHQQILQDLAKAREKAEGLKVADAEEILRQEKLRLIKEQTEENRDFLDSLSETDEEVVDEQESESFVEVS